MSVPWEDEDLLRELYHGHEMSQEEVAHAIGCSESTVKRHMKKKGIERRPPREARREKSAEERYKNTDHSKADLERMYYEEDMTQQDIADKLGVTQRGVSYWMQQLGMEAMKIRDGERDE